MCEIGIVVHDLHNVHERPVNYKFFTVRNVSRDIPVFELLMYDVIPNCHRLGNYTFLASDWEILQ